MSLKTKKILYYIVVPIYIIIVVLIIRSIECKFWNLDIALKIATFLKDIALATCPIITIYINIKMKKDELKHQKEIKKLELFDTKKREVLKDFINFGTEYLKDKSINNAGQIIKALCTLQLYFKSVNKKYLIDIRKQLSKEDRDANTFKELFYNIIDDLQEELEYYDNSNNH